MLLQSTVLAALEEIKANDVNELEVSKLCTFADKMVVATGTSQTHTRSIARKVVEKSKEMCSTKAKLHGYSDGEWILIDLGDIVVHVMSADARKYYQLEKFWEPDISQPVTEAAYA